MSAPDYSIGSDLLPGLSKLIEECGEVMQVAGKLLATGGDSEHWDGSDLIARMEDELGDLRAAIRFVVMVTESPFSDQRVGRREALKYRQFEDWHDEQRAVT